jgi:hypothetical protein
MVSKLASSDAGEAQDATHGYLHNEGGASWQSRCVDDLDDVRKEWELDVNGNNRRYH